MISYLQNGGNLYIESVNIAKDLTGTALNEYLGLAFIHDGNDNEVVSLFGNDLALTSQMEMNYQGGTDAHYNVDRMDTFTGQLLFHCDGDFGRMVLKEGENFKVVCSSVIMGALSNGYSLNLKPYLIGEMVNYFLGYDPTTGIENPEPGDLRPQISPNPFSYNARIGFSIKESLPATVKIFNSSGKMIKILMDNVLMTGDYSVNWDGRDFAGNQVENGVYFCEITSGSHSAVRKIIRIR